MNFKLGYRSFHTIAQMPTKHEGIVTEAPAGETTTDSEKGSDEAVESTLPSNELVYVPDGGLWAWMAVLGG